VLRKRLHLNAYNYPSINTLRMQIRWFVRNYVCKCFIGYKTMRFLNSEIFSDGSTFHVRDKINTHTCWIWDSEIPCAFLECSWQHKGERDLSPQRKSVRPFFTETTITDIVYLDMLQQFLIPVRQRWRKRAHSLPARRRTPSLPSKWASNSAPVSLVGEFV
jgi:hypothetical protein